MISLVIPFHKGIDYLEDCLDSLSAQTNKDIEVVVVLDNAEDVSDLISKYSELNIKVVNSSGEGVAAARNTGIENANGEYVYFLDSDDYLKEDAIEKLQTLANEKVDIIYSRVIHTWFQRAGFDMEQGDVSDEIDAKHGAKQVKDSTDGFDDFKEYKIGKHKAFKKVTALGVGYRLDFLNANKIRFDEDNKYYSDLKFVFQAESKMNGAAGDIESVYIKRYHNDSINLPALSQIKDENRDGYLVKAFVDTMEIASDENKKILFRMACTFYTTSFSKRFHADSVNNSSTTNFDVVRKMIADCPMDVINEWSGLDKKILKSAKKGKVSAVKRWSNLKLIKRKLYLITHKRMDLYRTINLYLFRHFKMKENWIVFESFMGRNYSGQPKYIYEYLQKTYGNKYKYIWMVSRKDLEIPGKCKQVKRLGLKYLYYMTRSKYWVNNMRQPHLFPKRKDQVMLSTWHGTPLKKLVFDMKDVHAVNPKYKEVVYEQTRKWDYLLSDNPFSTDVFESCFMYDRDKILEYGYPANDPLYDPNIKERAVELKKKMGIPLDKKVLLYAPTWRDDDSYGAGEYKFNLALDLKMLKEKLGDEYVVLLRMHYWIVDKLDLTGVEDFVVNVSSYSDITDIYIVSDICMTDYSSVFFDYSNLRRPILFYMYDLDKYRDVLRGFYLNVDEELPGPILTTNEQVLEALSNIDKVSEDYKDKYEKFYNRFCCVDDGNAAKRVVEKVFGK